MLPEQQEQLVHLELRALEHKVELDMEHLLIHPHIVDLVKDKESENIKNDLSRFIFSNTHLFIFIFIINIF